MKLLTDTFTLHVLITQSAKLGLQSTQYQHYSTLRTRVSIVPPLTNLRYDDS